MLDEKLEVGPSTKYQRLSITKSWLVAVSQ
jgi:hypothetical protein